MHKAISILHHHWQFGARACSHESDAADGLKPAPNIVICRIARNAQFSVDIHCPEPIQHYPKFLEHLHPACMKATAIDEYESSANMVGG